jgi:xylulokinase
MCADVQGKTYQLLNREDVALWGAALLAGNAIGVFRDLKQTAKAHVRVEKEYMPDAARTASYDQYLAIYEKYMVELHDFFARLQQIH